VAACSCNLMTIERQSPKSKYRLSYLLIVYVAHRRSIMFIVDTTVTKSIFMLLVT
jgi:hypothetical protein